MFISNGKPVDVNFWRDDCKNKSFLGEAKLDGWSLSVHPKGAFTRGGKTNYWSRVKHLFKNKPRHAVVGELYLPGLPSTSVSSALTKNDELQQKLRFCAFDLPLLKGTVLDIRHRLSNYGYEIPIQYGDKVLTTWKDTWEEIAKKDELEGLVFKQMDTTARVWYRIKLVKTCECVVVGLEPGRGKYNRDVTGALIVYVKTDPDKRQFRVSGMSANLQHYLRNTDIGRIIEVRYNSICSKGGLRHPRFIRFRDDLEY